MAMHDYSHRFDCVHIIESLRPGERRTGTELFETVVRPLGLRQRIGTQLHSVSSNSQLLDVLSDIAEGSQAGNHSPMIHLEMHGSKDGLGLSDDSFLPWDQIRDPLTRINTISSLNLVVTVAACQGEYLTRTLTPINASPVCMLIGCSESFWSNIAAEGFQAYYKELLTSLNGAEAWRALNAVGSKENIRFGAWPAKYFFINVYKHYVRKFFSPDVLQKRIGDISTRLQSSGRFLIRDGPSLRMHIATRLQDHDVWLRKFQRTFFMLEQFPENASRFQIAVQDLLLDSQAGRNDRP